MTDLTFDRLKERLDLLSEVEKDLGPGRKSGKWVLFSCPFPGHNHGDSNPSLGLTPETGRFFCFACGAKGDVLDWLHTYRGMTWKEITALEDSGNLPEARPRPARSAPDPEQSGPPAQAWQARGLAFVAYAERELWEGAGTREKVYRPFPGGDLLTPLEYLHWRGLSEETIRFWRLGYNPKDCYDKRDAWGLNPKLNDKGHESKVKLEQGITIPCLITRDWATVAKDLWYIKIRRLPGKVNSITGNADKFTRVTGPGSALFGADNLYIAGNGTGVGVLTEGEFDVILAGQVLPEVGFATLGSASDTLNLAAWGAYLLPLRWLLAAYDVDKAGISGASRLAQVLRKIHPVRVPALRAGDKDITDYTQAGGDLWAWLRYNLESLGALGALGGLLGACPEPMPAELEAALTAGMVQA